MWKGFSAGRTDLSLAPLRELRIPHYSNVRDTSRLISLRTNQTRQGAEDEKAFVPCSPHRLRTDFNRSSATCRLDHFFAALAMFRFHVDLLVSVEISYLYACISHLNIWSNSRCARPVQSVHLKTRRSQRI